MIPVLFASTIHVVFMVLMSLTALFLMLIVLVQRGRGGGLAGAFGGAGGQSAFGTKAGDLFTRITIGVAIFWVLLCLVALKVLGTTKSRFGQMPQTPTADGLIDPGGSGGEDPTGTGDAGLPADGLGTGESSEGGAGAGESAGDGAEAGESESSGAAPAAEDNKKD